MPIYRASFTSWLILAVFLVAQVAQAQESAPSKSTPETFLLLPEPHIMRSPRSMNLKGSKNTVITPAKEVAESPFITTYTAAELLAIGISPETFAKRARNVADQLLRDLKPEWIRDEQGQIIYAVYRGERPIYASLMMAPSLPLLFEATFGPEIWVTSPDRNALYVFPAKAAILNDFAGDLEDRFKSEPYAATSEIFSWKKGAIEPVAVGSFAE